MQVQNDRHSWNVRALVESTATPFTLADYGPRAAIFRQGDPCDSVMHVARGRVWLAVTARSGKEAICGVVGTGAFLGEEAPVGLGERRQSAIAMTAMQVLVVAPNHRDGVVHPTPATTRTPTANISTAKTTEYGIDGRKEKVASC